MTKKQTRSIIEGELNDLETSILAACNTYDYYRAHGASTAMLTHYENIIHREEVRRRRLNGILAEYDHLSLAEIEEKLDDNR